MLCGVVLAGAGWCRAPWACQSLGAINSGNGTGSYFGHLGKAKGAQSEVVGGSVYAKEPAYWVWYRTQYGILTNVDRY